MSDGCGDDVDAALETLRRRQAVLEEVRDGPTRPRDVVAALDASRTTVNRALRDLADAGLVERAADGGYVATPVATVAVDERRAYRDRMADAFAAADALAPLSEDHAVTASLLEGADVTTADGPFPVPVAEAVDDQAARATELRVVLSTGRVPGLLARIADALATGTDVDLVVDRSLVDELAAEYPGVLATVFDHDRATVYGGECPAVTVVHGGGAVTVAVPTDRGAVTGLLTNDTDAAIGWGLRVYQRSREATLDRDDVTPKIDENPDAPLTGRDWHAEQAPNPRAGGNGGLPDALRRAGFRRLDADHFTERDPVAPTVAWRTGLTPAEVAAGYAVDRQHVRDGERVSLVSDVLERARNGRDVAVVGPPGSGKSTCCLQVAYRWYERGIGPCIHRPGDGSDAVDDPGRLERYLRDVDGHALVVVEDAVRADATAALEAMVALGGRDDVTFLLDARLAEWERGEDLPPDARLESYLRRTVDVVEVPALDEAARRRLAATFERVTGVDLPDDAVEGVGDVTSGGDDVTSGGDEHLLTVLDRLARYANPVANHEARTPTALAERVQRFHERVRTTGDPEAPAVALAVSLWNAAGLGVREAGIRALADRYGDETVRTALTVLRGEVLFSRAVNGGGPNYFRTVHEWWSTVYLGHLATAADGPVAEWFRAAVAVAADLTTESAADAERGSPSADERRSVDGEGVAAVETAASPVERTVERVLAFAVENPRVAPLVGDAETPLPRADDLSTAFRARCRYWQGEAHARAGDFEPALAALDASLAAAESVAGVTGRRIRADALLSKADATLDVTDDRDAALLAGEALALASALNDDGRRARALRTLSDVAQRRDDYHDGRRYARAALDALGGDRPPLARARCAQDLAVCELHLGDLDAARERATEALEAARAAGARRLEAQACNDLGRVARRQSEYDTARRRFRQAFEAWDRLGDDHGRCIALGNLGLVHRSRHELDAAAERFEHSLALARETGDEKQVATARQNLAEVARLRGEFDRSVDLAEAGIETASGVDATSCEQACAETLGLVAHQRGDLSTAIRWFDRALSAARAAGDRHAAANAHVLAAEALSDRGCPAPARDHAQQALSAFDALDSDTGRIKAHHVRATAAMRAGDIEVADEQLRQALALAREVDLPFYEARVREARGDLAEARGDLAEARGDPITARDRYESAAERYESAGAADAADTARDRISDLAESVPEDE